MLFFLLRLKMQLRTRFCACPCVMVCGLVTDADDNLKGNLNNEHGCTCRSGNGPECNSKWPTNCGHTREHCCVVKVATVASPRTSPKVTLRVRECAAVQLAQKARSRARVYKSLNGGEEWIVHDDIRQSSSRTENIIEQQTNCRSRAGGGLTNKGTWRQAASARVATSPLVAPRGCGAVRSCAAFTATHPRRPR